MLKKNLLALLMIPLSLMLLVIACQKGITDGGDKAAFNVKEAKEWWYGSFVKSNEYMTTPRNGKISPDWNNATYKRVGNMEIIEMPLQKERKSIRVPSYGNTTAADRKRIAAASLTRLVLMRNGSGKIKARVMEYIPEKEYLQKNNYDISHLGLGRKDANYSGIMNINTWSGKPITKRRIQNGKFTRIIRDGEAAKITAKTSTYEQCFTSTTTEEIMWCYGYMSGDVMIVTGCSDWEEVSSTTTQECETIEEDECAGLSEEECLCALTGYCDGGGDGDGGGGGGGGDDPPPSLDPCADAQPSANAVTALSQNSNYATAKSSIQTASSDGNEHSITFGRDANNNITTSAMINGGTSGGNVNTSWPGAFADLHNHPDDQPPSPGDLYGLVTINNNHSGYNTRMVVTSDGSVYALVVVNLTTANTFVTNYPKEQVGNFPPDFPDPIFTDFSNVKVGLQMQGFSNLVAEEMAMAFVLDKYNSGMALLKQDSNGNFKRLRTEQNTSNGSTTYTANNCQ